MKCALCDRPLSRDNRGPIEGRQLWVRKGEDAPSPFVEGEEGEWHLACDACVRLFSPQA